MPQWDVKPDQVAAALIAHFPYQAEQIVLDFLQGASGGADPAKMLFWSMVHGFVEKMQMTLAVEPGYAPALRAHAMM